MTSVIVNGVEYVRKPAPIRIPRNDMGATHWAVLPDGSLAFYKIGSEVLLWYPISTVGDGAGMAVWGEVTLAPYTLHCFDDIEEKR